MLFVNSELKIGFHVTKSAERGKLNGSYLVQEKIKYTVVSLLLNLSLSTLTFGNKGPSPVKRSRLTSNISTNMYAGVSLQSLRHILNELDTRITTLV